MSCFTAGYALPVPVREGRQRRKSARHQFGLDNFNLWTRYRFSDDPNRGWRVGAGVNTASGIYADSADFRLEQGGYTTLSAMVGYRVSEHLDFRPKR
ncbi:TonB-dependent receptor [Billgrantia gudaonensis]|uniref:TonB-dependent receptor n=1 Tax=Billgrantia gudaonensis TaxID=376427 RepID=A0A3S0VSU2_9GAMM|nr:TonB-dependent receptor [Halomonas gudaonensis]